MDVVYVYINPDKTSSNQQKTGLFLNVAHALNAGSRWGLTSKQTPTISIMTRVDTMPNSTRDEIKQAAEQAISDYIKTAAALGSDCTYPREYRLARALLSAYEREDKMLATLKSNLGDVKRLNELASALGVMPFSRMEYDIYDAIKAAEEGQG